MCPPSRTLVDTNGRLRHHPAAHRSLCSTPSRGVSSRRHSPSRPPGETSGPPRRGSRNFSAASPGAPNLTQKKPEANCSIGVAVLGTRPQGVHIRCLRVHRRTGRDRDQDNDGAKPNVPKTALTRFSLGHVELLSGIRKLNFGLLEFLHEPKIDGLLHIHVCVVIGAEHN